MKKPGAGGGDMTLESRHLVGLFLGVVVLCCVFFTLGYVMGNSQDSSARVMAAANDAKPSASPEAAAKSDATQSAVPAPSEWRFPAAAEPAKPAEKIEPSKPAVELNPPAGSATGVARPPAIGSAPAPSSKPAPSATPSKSKATAPPRIAKGSILLQVAALTRESDALLLAEALQRKNFPAFLTTPGADKYYRVQVGPYADKESADLAKRALEREGFKAIVKR